MVDFSFFDVSLDFDYARGSLQDHCFRGNRQEVAKFLETKDGKDLKIDIDEPDTAGIRTPLHYACLGGRLNVVILLVENGATIDVPKNWKSSRGSFPASFYAAAVGSESVLQFLFKRGASSSQIHQNLSLLHIAIHRNHLSLADRLLHRGMSPELDSGWMPPLHVAAQDGNLPAGRLLIDYGARVTSPLGKPNPLHIAARSGAIGLVETLISAGCSVDDRSGMGTPLCCACQSGQVDIVQMLIKKGASVRVNFEDKFGTPVHIASETGSVELFNLLMDHGANIAVTAKNHRTPLHTAAEKGHYGMVKALIDAKADVNAVTATRRTPLHEAAEAGHWEIVRYLIDVADADVLIQDTNGKTARQVAKNSSKEISSFLSAIETIRQTEKSATSISLASCGLEAVPEQIQHLRNLQTIDLRHNKLQTIPPSITLLKNLQSLKLTGNPLSLLPKEVLGEKGSNVLSFLKDLKETNQFWTRVKLMIVGKEAVGKTSLFRALAAEKGSVKLDQRGDTISTEGIDISNLQIGPYQFSTWDFGGQEVFYPTHTFFLTKRAIYLVLFNILDDDLSRVEYWIRLIKASTDQAPPLLLMATHADLISSSETLSKRIATVRERFKSHRNIQMIAAISSATKDGIPEFCDKLIKVAKDSGMVTRKVAGSYLLLERRIDHARKERPTLSWTEFLQYARECGIPTEAMSKSVCRFFHDVGVLLHFDDSRSNLSDLIILDPQWLANVMSSLVSFRTESNILAGVLNFQKLCYIWHEFSDEMRMKLLLLLEKFEVAYRMRPAYYNPNVGTLKGDDFGSSESSAPAANPSFPIPSSSSSSSSSLPSSSEQQNWKNVVQHTSSFDIVVPSLLPGEPPDQMELSRHWPLLEKTRVGTDEYRRIYQFDFLPLGLFGRIIVRMLHIADVTCPLKWREGIVLRSKNHEGSFITFNSKGYQLHIHHRTYHYRGQASSSALLSQLIFAIDSLLEGYYPGLAQGAQKLVPCRHCFTVPPKKITMFTFEECSSAVQSENPYVICNGVCINVAYLAPDIAMSGLKQITDLTILKKIGEGGYGTVYKGMIGDQLVAVKELKLNEEDSADLEGAAGEYASHRDSAVSQEALEQFQEFQRECFIMSRLKHPNLVDFYGVALRPHIRMVMEFVPCGDLQGLIDMQQSAVVEADSTLMCLDGMEMDMKAGEVVYVIDSAPDVPNTEVTVETVSEQKGTISRSVLKFKTPPIPDAEISFDLRLKIMYDIAKGMRYLQGMVPPIIHRDLRSPNIFLMSTDPLSRVTAKVADFGLSRLVETKIGGALGTWQWLAPEVIDTKVNEYDERSDIYSFGIVCYEVFTRRIPFTHDYTERFVRNGFFNKWGCIDAIVNEELRPILPDDLPESLRVMIEQCWSSEPSLRTPFPAIVKRLRVLMKEHGSPLEEVQDGYVSDDDYAEMVSSVVQTSSEVKNVRYSTSLRIDVPTVEEKRFKPICLEYVAGLVVTGCMNGLLYFWNGNGSFLKSMRLTQDFNQDIRMIQVINDKCNLMLDNGAIHTYRVPEWEFCGRYVGPHKDLTRGWAVIRTTFLKRLKQNMLIERDSPKVKQPKTKKSPRVKKEKTKITEELGEEEVEEGGNKREEKNKENQGEEEGRGEEDAKEIEEKKEEKKEDEVDKRGEVAKEEHKCSTEESEKKESEKSEKKASHKKHRKKRESLIERRRPPPAGSSPPSSPSRHSPKRFSNYGGGSPFRKEETENQEMYFAFSADINGQIHIQSLSSATPTTVETVMTGFPIVCLDSIEMKGIEYLVAAGDKGQLYEFYPVPLQLISVTEGAHQGSRVIKITSIPSTQEIWTGGYDGSICVWSLMDLDLPIEMENIENDVPVGLPEKPSRRPRANRLSMFEETQNSDLSFQQHQSLEHVRSASRPKSLTQADGLTMKSQGGGGGGGGRNLDRSLPLKRKPWVLVTSLRPHQARVSDIFRVKDDIVCSVSFDRTIRFWDPVTHVGLQELHGHEDCITAARCFPQDGYSLWTGSMDRSICVWTTSESKETSTFADDLDLAYHTYQKGLQRTKTPSKVEEAEEEVGEMVKEDATLEDRIRIIDTNIAGLKKMNRSHAMNMDKAMKLCDIILRDLKDAIARSESDHVMMSQLEDRITVTLLEKKQLKTKRTEQAQQNAKQIQKQKEEAPKSALEKSLLRIETYLNHFHRALRVVVEEYCAKIQPLVSPSLVLKIFRNLEEMYNRSGKLRQSIRDVRGSVEQALAKEKEKREKEKKEAEEKGETFSEPDPTIDLPNVFKAFEVVQSLFKFFTANAEHLLSYSRHQHTAFCTLQMIMYRPFISVLLKQQEDALGEILEDLLLAPILFVRGFPFLLRTLSQELPVESDAAINIVPLLRNVDELLRQINENQHLQQMVSLLTFQFFPYDLPVVENLQFLREGTATLRSMSVVSTKPDEAVLVSQSRTLNFYIFSTLLILVTSSGGNKGKIDLQRRVVVEIKSSSLKLEDMESSDGSSMFSLLFPIRKEGFFGEELKEKWVLAFQSSSSKAYLMRILCELLFRNKRKAQERVAIGRIETSSRVASNNIRYGDSFSQSCALEAPLTEKEVFYLKYFGPYRHYVRKEMSLLNVLVKGEIEEFTKKTVGKAKTRRYSVRLNLHSKNEQKKAKKDNASGSSERVSVREGDDDEERLSGYLRKLRDRPTSISCPQMEGSSDELPPFSQAPPSLSTSSIFHKKGKKKIGF